MLRPGAIQAAIRRANLGGLIKAWKQRFSVIIVNSAALPRYPDTAGIARHADKSLLVVRLGGTDTTQLERAAGTLKSLGTTAPAVVTVGARSLPAYGERYELSVLQATTRPTSTGE